MDNVRFDQKTLTALKQPAKRIGIPDPKTPGLVLRVTPSGAKTYYFVYRLGGRETRKHWLKMASFNDLPLVRAQEMARSYRAQVDRGEDPGQVIRDKANEGATIKDLAKRFEEEYLPRLAPRSQVDYKSAIRVHILPKLGKIEIKKLDRDQIIPWHSRIKGKRVANLALAILSCMMTQAMLWKLRPETINPCCHVKRHTEEPRVRDISDDELKALGKAIQDLQGVCTPWSLAAIKVTALCWGRLSEVLSLRRDKDCFLDEGYALIRDHKGRKQQGAKRLELAPQVVEILRSLPEVVGNPFYFANSRGVGQPITRHGLRATWLLVCEKANVADLHVHDFRSLAASEGEEQGVSPKTMAAVLGHSDPKTTMKYYAKARKRKTTEVAAQVAAPIAAAMGI